MSSYLRGQLLVGETCIDYRMLNKATRKDHFPFPFIDEMLEWLAKHSYFCYLDGYSGYHHQIAIHPDDQNKTTFTCPYGTFAYRRMSFGLCNAPTSFQRCMKAIFFDLIENIFSNLVMSESIFPSSTSLRSTCNTLFAAPHGLEWL